MGFMGIEDIGDSDCTFDYMCGLTDKIKESVKTQMIVKTNEYNTHGYIDVLLCLKSIINKENSFYFTDESWYNEVWLSLEGMLNKQDCGYRKMRGYKKLVTFVRIMIETCKENLVNN